MIWNERIKNLLNKTVECEILHSNGCWSSLPSITNIATLIGDLSEVKEIETILLYEITSKHYFNLENYRKDDWIDIYKNVKLLHKLDNNTNYKETIKAVKENEVTKKVRLQLLNIEITKDYYFNGWKNNYESLLPHSHYFYEKAYLSSMLFYATFRTMNKNNALEKAQVFVYDSQKYNVEIKIEHEDYRFGFKTTIEEKGIRRIKEMPINLARLWCHRWDVPFTDMEVGHHYDSFKFCSKPNLTTEMNFNNGVSINNVPINESNYAYGLAKDVFSILKEHNVDLSKLDRDGELY